MTDTIFYLFETIYEFWYALIYDNMIYGQWNDPSYASNNIIDGELIKINLTWLDLPSVLAAITIILLVYFFIKFVVKLLGIFVWK